MSTITPINSAYRQNLAFGAENADAKQKRHPVKAVLFYGIPGVGEMTNGDTKKGLKHLGTSIVLGAAAGALYIKKFIPSLLTNMEAATKVAMAKGINMEYFKTAYKDVSKKSLAGMAVLGALGVANATSAAISTYKGKETA